MAVVGYAAAGEADPRVDGLGGNPLWPPKMGRRYSRAPDIELDARQKRPQPVCLGKLPHEAPMCRIWP